MTAEIPVVVLVGATGRAGRTVVERMRGSAEVIALGRYDIENPDPFESELRDALPVATSLINVAGIAHIDGTPSDAEIHRLVAANIELPLLLARRCLEERVPLLHVSSSKAGFSGGEANLYSWSKRICDATLSSAYGDLFAESGLPLTIFRPPALLIPPFDTGRLRHLRRLAVLPSWATPRIPMPALSANEFADDLVSRSTSAHRSPRGVTIVDYPANTRASLRTIRASMISERKGGQHAC